MKLTKANGRYELVSSFEERMVPKQAGFRWDPARKIWWTDVQEKAARLIDHADDDIRGELAGLADRQKRSMAASRSANSDQVFPIAEGMEYLGYQKAGIAYAMERPSVLFGDEMGLGKTVEAIGVINARQDVQRVLVVCPANLKINWQRELTRFLARPFAIQIANGKPIDMPTAGSGQIVIINYDILNKHMKTLQAIAWDLVIVDEAHYIKNSDRKKVKVDGLDVWKFKTQRTQALFDIGAAAKYKVMATGTPQPNRPKELWTLLHWLDATRWAKLFQLRAALLRCYQRPLRLGL
jgi:hypothetical protein